MAIFRWTLASLLAQVSVAQVRILNPPSLITGLIDIGAKGGDNETAILTGSTAAFGSPYYEEKVSGQLLYAPSNADNYCTEASYTMPDADEGKKAIFLIPRGGCSFVQKVQTAQDKGAHAVLLLDYEGSDITSRQRLRQIIMGTDGFAQKVFIPSILMFKDDAKLLQDEASRGTKIYTELDWSPPSDDQPDIQFWTSPGNLEGVRFLRDFAKYAMMLKDNIKFKVVYHVVKMTIDDFRGMCWDATEDFCTDDPDRGAFLTGKDVLEEGVRQHCIQDTSENGHEDHYSEKWWKYVEKIGDACPAQCTDMDIQSCTDMSTLDRIIASGDIDCSPDQPHMSLSCSEGVMRDVGINPTTISECANEHWRTILEADAQEQAWAKVALRINNWRYAGPLDAESVAQLICQKAFNDSSVVNNCEEIIAIASRSVEEGVAKTTVLVLVIILVSAFLLLGVCYRRYLIKRTKEDLRYEIMAEVQNQMEPSRMGGARVTGHTYDFEMANQT